ncbi:MAG: hypothetical protein OXF54_11430 [Caldilineaceae bacterium]|nr:hypothetical protein [Caldilineaceae bacterium]
MTESIDGVARIVAAAVERQSQSDGAEESPGMLVVSAMGGATITLTDEAQAGLHAVDYTVWALQRLFERYKERNVTYLWPAIRLVQDVEGR